MAATVRDVAALAGVSPSTVSRTLRNSSSISEKTQEKVRDAMAQLGYEPPKTDFTTKEKDGSVRNIGVILPPAPSASFENPFFLEVLRGISQYCNEQSYMTSLIAGKDNDEILSTIRALVRNKSISGFIVLFSRTEDPIVDYLYDEGIDYVQIGQPTSHPNDTFAVDNDNISAGQEAARYLYDLGHRRIGFLGSSIENRFSVARRNGVRLFLGDQGLSLNPDWCVESDYGNPEAITHLKNMLGADYESRPTAMICGDEMHAISLRQMAAEIGLKIPDDLSILSFNNSVISQMTDPQLTSIDVNALQLGIEAAIQAVKHRENPGLMPSRTLVPYQLIERDSCKETKIS